MASLKGGGARGLAHVGALKACEERKIRFEGVAGTSAGAIIAGLIAVGYSADELFSSPGGVLDRDYLSLLGPQEWYRAADAIGIAQSCFAKLSRPEPNPNGLIQRIPILSVLPKSWRKLQLGYQWMRLGNALNPLVPTAGDLGYFSSRGFENWYNDLLAQKLVKDRTITFADIDFDLRIISAELRTSSIVVHSATECPGRSVAEAVAASISIPIVFEPRAISENGRSGLHVDGGMLSNFPAWLFAQESKAIGDPVPVLGFELVDRHDNLPANPDFFSFLRGLLATTIAGKKGMEIRGLHDIHSVQIPVSAGTFDFSTSADIRTETYDEGLKAARGFFPTELQLVTQEQMAPFLYEGYREIVDAVGRPVHLRVNIMDKNSLGRLSIRYQYNMDFDSDDRMDLPLDAGGAGQCFTSKKIRTVDLGRAKREFSSFKMSKYEQALVRSSLRSLLSVPLFLPGWQGEESERPVIGVLNIDSEQCKVHCSRRKNGTASVHPLTDVELRALGRLKHEAPQSRYVFLSERGAPFTVGGFRRMVTRLGVKAGFTFQVHPHMLRHACGYKLANDGRDTRAIQHYLGHRNIQHTVGYTALASDRFKGFWMD